MRSSLQSNVMFLNPGQIDKTNSTLLNLRARCVVGQNNLQEAKGNPKTRYVKGQVRNARGRYMPGLKRKGQITPDLKYDVQKTCFKKVGAKSSTTH